MPTFRINTINLLNYTIFKNYKYTIKFEQCVHNLDVHLEYKPI